MVQQGSVKDVNWGKVEKIFRVDFLDQDGEIVFSTSGWKLIKGDHGYFVGSPSKKGSDGNYYNIFYFPDKNKRTEFNKMLIEQLEDGGVGPEDVAISGGGNLTKTEYDDDVPDFW
jgi:DNA-binding cell septation regulator SpoVG